MKYILVQWPEIQDYMEHPRYNECFSANKIDENDSNSYWFVPVDLIAEVEYVKFQETAEFVWDGQVFTRDIYAHPIKKDDIVLFTDNYGRFWTSKCIRSEKKFPMDIMLFEGHETPGIGCYIEGVKI